MSDTWRTVKITSLAIGLIGVGIVGILALAVGACAIGMPLTFCVV